MSIQRKIIITNELDYRTVHCDTITDKELESLLYNIHTNFKGCWVRGNDSTIYTRVRIGNDYRLAHRVSYEVFTGNLIPSNRLGLHKCDVKACIKPEHIYPGDDGQNFYDILARKYYTKNKIREDTVKEVKLILRNNKLKQANNKLFVKLNQNYKSNNDLLDRLNKLSRSNI